MKNNNVLIVIALSFILIIMLCIVSLVYALENKPRRYIVIQEQDIKGYTVVGEQPIRKYTVIEDYSNEWDTGQKASTEKYYENRGIK